MVEVFAVASGKGGTGKTTATLALGMALADEYDVTVVDADTGMANLLFHAGLDDVGVTLHDLLVEEEATDPSEAVPGEATDPSEAVPGEATDPSEAVYERFGMRVVPCGTSLAAFQAADPERLRGVVADLAAETDVLLLDSPAALGSKSAVLPLVLADRSVIVLEPTIPAISDGLKVQEYGRSYGTDTAGVLFNRVRDGDVDRVVDRARRYFGGDILGTVPESDAARRARRAGEPLLAAHPDSPAAAAFEGAADALEVRDGSGGDVADRFRSAVVPEDV